MVTIKINEADYAIRTNWNEVTLNAYCDIVKVADKPFAERLSVYSGIPLEIVNQMKLPQIAVISEVTEFMETYETVNAFGVGYESDLSIGEQPYWKIEKAKQLLKETTPMLVAAEIVDLYTSDKDGNGGLKIGEKTITEIIGMCAFFLSVSQNSLNDLKG